MADASKEDITAKLGHLDRRVMYWILVIIIVFTLFFPIGLPLKVSPRTQDFYRVLKEVPDGSTIVLSLDCMIETWPELGPSAIAIAKIIPEKHLKAVIWGYLQDASLLGEKYIVPVLKEAGLKNGIDYVLVGFIPGGETTIARLATDIHGVIKKDFYGTSIEELPVMKEIRGSKDIALVVTVDAGTGSEFYVRHWKPLGTPIISALNAIMVTANMPFLDSGQLSAMLMGAKGAAELEKLSGHLGKGVGMMDMLSLTQTVLIILIILGNYSYFRFRSKRRG